MILSKRAFESVLFETQGACLRMGRMGWIDVWDEWMGRDIKSVFFFHIYYTQSSILKYIIKNFLEKLKKLVKVLGPDAKIQNHPLSLIFFHIKSRPSNFKSS